jgi:hypothetical protein
LVFGHRLFFSLGSCISHYCSYRMFIIH